MWSFESAKRWTCIFCLVQLARRSGLVYFSLNFGRRLTTVWHILVQREMKMCEARLLKVVAISQTKKKIFGEAAFQRQTYGLDEELKDIEVHIENVNTKAVCNTNNLE